MNFTEVPSGTAVFVDANIFIYAFAPDPHLGAACVQLLKRIEKADLLGFTSSHVLSSVAHRLMSIEACKTFGWPFAGVGRRLKQRTSDVQQLKRFGEAIDLIADMKVQVWPVAFRHVTMAVAVSQKLGLLSNDALIVALMNENSVSYIASNDGDFDRVSELIRVVP